MSDRSIDDDIDAIASASRRNLENARERFSKSQWLAAETAALLDLARGARTAPTASTLPPVPATAQLLLEVAELRVSVDELRALVVDLRAVVAPICGRVNDVTFL